MCKPIGLVLAWIILNSWIHLDDINRIEKHSNGTQCYCTSRHEINRRIWRHSARSTMNFRSSASFHFKFTNERATTRNNENRSKEINAEMSLMFVCWLRKNNGILSRQTNSVRSMWGVRWSSASLCSTLFDSFDICDSLIFELFYFHR